MKLDPGNRIVKQYFVVVDKDDKVKKVCWAPLLWDIPNLGYRFTGFAGFTGWRIPKFLYVGPDIGFDRVKSTEMDSPAM